MDVDSDPLAGQAEPEDEEDPCAPFDPATDPSEPLLAVMDHREFSGVYEPGYIKSRKHGAQTYDWRDTPGSPDNSAWVKPAQRIYTIRDAFEMMWSDEAMGVRYLLKHPNGYWMQRQPRINKTSIPWLESEGFTVWMNTLFIDVDNPGHRQWTQEDTDNFQRFVTTAEGLRTAGVYVTKRGWRIVQPVWPPVPIKFSEEVIRKHMLELEKQGIGVDWKCADWGHLFKMPNVFSNGEFIRGNPDLSRMVAIDVTPYLPKEKPAEEWPESTYEPPTESVSAPADSRKKHRDTKPRRIVSDIHFTSEIPSYWITPIDMLAKAVFRNVTKEWHHMYLYMAGALAFKKVPHEYIPEIIRRVALQAESMDPSDKRSWADSHHQSAVDTCLKHAQGVKVGGWNKLLKGWPPIAAAVRRAVTREEILKQWETSERAQTPSLSDARDELYYKMIGAGGVPGVSIIRSGCGVGKTHAAWNAAKFRAETVAPDVERTPPGVKTALSFDKNKLAIQTTDKLIEARALVKRFRSPLSVLKEDGTPECRFAANAKAIQMGGQSVMWEFCEGRQKHPCMHRPPEGKCRAYGQWEGDEDARIATGNHALLKQLTSFVGASGLLIIDEPPPLLETVSITPEEFVAVKETQHHFIDRYGYAMHAISAALYEWSKTAEIYDDQNVNSISVTEALVNGSDLIPDSLVQAACASQQKQYSGSKSQSMVECVKDALPEDHKGTAPPVRRHTMFQARNDLGLAQRIGKASKVMHLLYEIITLRLGDPALRCSVRVEEKVLRGGRSQRVVLLTAARIDMVEALRRQGPTVISDANADLVLPVLEGILGTEEKPFVPTVHMIDARDRARVDRFIAPYPKSSRSGWMVSGRPVWQPIVDGLRRVMHWARQDPEAKVLCLITYLVIETALRATLYPEDRKIDERWVGMGRSLEELAELRVKLGPVLASWKGEWILGHYGGIRGMDDAMRADTYVAFGDPWPNLGEIRNELSFLGSTKSVDARARELCAAELEQVFGRGRTPERTSSCRQLHVGNVLPSGILWSSPDVVTMEIPVGRIADIPELTCVEFREIRERMELSQAKYAEALAISLNSVKRYEISPENGGRPVPQGVAIACMELFQRFEGDVRNGSDSTEEG